MRILAFAVLGLSASICGTDGSAATSSSSAEAAASAYLDAHLADSRYLSTRCEPDPVTDWPGYEGRAVQRCSYEFTSNGKTLSGLVYLLNPTAANIALRVGRACGAIGLAESPQCGSNLARFIVRQNGGQYPVAGFVIERKQDAGGSGPDPVYLEFRDGNTVQTTDHLNFTTSQLSVAAMEHAARAPIAETRNVARIANAYRADYRRAGGSEPVGDEWKEDRENRWPSVIRVNELRAQDTGDDLLLVGVAMSMRGNLAAVATRRVRAR